MSSELPKVGTREGLKIEFKRAEKLRGDEGRNGLVRSVVSLRNAQGGTIWVGAIEQGEELTGWESLTEGDRNHVNSLQDKLVDCIEPRVQIGLHVILERVPRDSGDVLAIQVKALRKKPPFACYSKGNQREFLRRSGSRTTTIPVSELFATASGNNEPSLREDVEVRHREWCKQFERLPGLAISAVPHPLNPDAESVPPGWRALVENPDEMLARPGGATWRAGQWGRIQEKRGTLISGSSQSKDEAYRVLHLHPDGRLHFYTALDDLKLGQSWAHSWTNEDAPRIFGARIPVILDPRKIVETVTSFVRLVARVHAIENSDTADEIGLILSFENARGYAFTIRDGNPDTTTRRSQWVCFDAPSVASRALIRSRDDLVERTDAYSFDLLSDIYSSDKHIEFQESLIPWFTPERKFRAPA